VVRREHREASEYQAVFWKHGWSKRGPTKPDCWPSPSRAAFAHLQVALDYRGSLLQGRLGWGYYMDSSLLREQAARCRALAEKADQFTKRRLLDLLR
jgi:hypothetical protein